MDIENRLIKEDEIIKKLCEENGISYHEFKSVHEYVKSSMKELRADLDKLKPPEPPPTRILKEGVIPTCHKCGSSLRRRWFKYTGCIQPKCSNYYKNT